MINIYSSLLPRHMYSLRGIGWRQKEKVLDWFVSTLEGYGQGLTLLYTGCVSVQYCILLDDTNRVLLFLLDCSD
jgi:hypothetical protein